MRDDIPRLSQKEIVILTLLVSMSESYGLALVEASQGHLKRGTIYVTLSRMAKKGYVDSREEPTKEGEIGPPRRVYWVTGKGKRALDAWELFLEYAKQGKKAIFGPSVALGGAV